MARRARLLIAFGENPITATALAQRAGLKSSEYVYRFVRAERQICGKLWKFLTVDEAKLLGVGDNGGENVEAIDSELAAAVLKAQREAERNRNVPTIMQYSQHQSASGSNVMPINPYGPGNSR